MNARDTWMRSLARSAILMVPFQFLAHTAAPSLPDLSPAVSSIFPLGGRPGETLQVDIAGRRLDGALEVTFARPDIKAELISSSFRSAKVKVTVGPVVPTGLHDYRLKTKNGVFVGVFHVGTLPGGREAEPNNDITRAQRINLPTMMDGDIGGPDFDVYRFHAEEGQTLIFDLLARRAGSTLDANLGVLDERGNELDFNEDYYIHKDPQLTFPVKRSGDYFIRVGGQGEGRRGGGNAAPYRLLAGAFPLIRQVLPAGMRRGATTELRAAGLNLQGVDRVVLGDGLCEGKVVSATGELLTVRFDVPTSVKPGRYQIHAFAGKLESPLPLPVIVSDLEEKLSTPARNRAQPQPVRAPAAYSGVLEHRRESHFFSLDVREGERLVFDVDAMKLGYLLDPIVAIYSLDGDLIASDDDRLQQNGKQVPNLDPYLVYRFEKSGRFIVMIRDLAERGDSNYVYRLAIYPAEPDFDLKIMVPSITLYRGQTVELPVRVRRHGGWDSPIDVWVENPPAGVANGMQTAEPKPTIVTDDCSLERRLDGTNVYVPIHVPADAVPGYYTLRLRARGALAGHTVEHTGEVQYKWESVGKVSGPIEDQQFIATISDLPPVLLEPPESLTLTMGKPARFRVLVTRFDGGKDPLTVEPETAIEGVTFENNVLAPGANQVEMRVTASGRVKSGNFRLKAGPGISQTISLRVGQGSEEDDQQ